MPKVIDMKGKHIKNLTVIKYVGSSKWLCKCDCGEEKIMDSRVLRNGRFAYCNKALMNDIIINDTYGNLRVTQINNCDSIICECCCGNIIETSIQKIKQGKRSCGHEKISNMINKIYGSWKVIGFKPPNYCTCIDINTNIQRDVNMYDLLRGKSRSSKNTLIDLTGQHIGNWIVLEYIGDQLWKCQCQCEKKTIKLVDAQSLRMKTSLSCGCNHYKNQFNTMINKYGETNINKKADNRELWQIEALQDRDKLCDVISTFAYKPTAHELSIKLNISKCTLLRKIRKFELQDKIELKPSISSYEEDIASILSKYNIDIIRNSRSIIDGFELDFYIPSKRLAIEFNGTYWHSSYFKNKYYHQQKTIACAKQGIRLIHIFEYEWLNNNIQFKIKRLIDNIMHDTSEVIWARNTVLRELDDVSEFLNEYHIQNESNSSINLGCFYKDELIGVMTFGKPRFYHEYQYEIHRFCWKDNIHVIGGAEKLFNYFVDNYNPTSIITYADISKFTGNSYLKLGFKPIQPKPITEPNYVWVEPYKNIVMNRYQTQKHKLISNNLGNEIQTEDEIMSSLDFLKIYDSGNIRLEWRK